MLLKTSAATTNTREGDVQRGGTVFLGGEALELFLWYIMKSSIPLMVL